MKTVKLPYDEHQEMIKTIEEQSLAIKKLKSNHVCVIRQEVSYRFGIKNMVTVGFETENTEETIKYLLSQIENEHELVKSINKAKETARELYNMLTKRQKRRLAWGDKLLERLY